MRRVLLIVLCIAGSQTALGADPEISNLVTGRWGSGIEKVGTQMLDFAWQPEARWRFDDGGRLTGIARLRWQPEPGMRPSDMERGTYAEVSKPVLIGDNAELALRELYYERSVNDWYMTLGKQQIVWGKADGLKVLDVVNPQSFREFILEDFDQSRIPLWTLNAEHSFYDWLGGDWTLQLLWIPDRTYHALPKQGVTYAFSSPRLVPQAPPGVAVRLNDPQRPDDGVLQNSDAGTRLTGFVGGWDLSLTYLYQYHNQPAFHQRFVPGLTPVVEVTPRYHRTHVVGGTFSRAFGDWVIRGEIGYFTDRFFLTDNPTDTDGVAESAELSYVLGLDWSGLDDSFISAQLFQSWLPGYQAGFTRPEMDTSVTFLARRDFWNDTLIAELLWITKTNDGDGLLRPKVSYELEDNIEIWLGLDLFYGDRQGLFGQFDDNDRLLVGVKLGL
ncbi:MAG: hypothetical protein ISQ58_07970 [Pseudomonadales bacterium]|nr:hypothetical protein [Pseudomonadales bacterium]MBL6817049.1 hypothetical protein [Pseudomonadales bacterium]